jgi:hypothetical protein
MTSIKVDDEIGINRSGIGGLLETLASLSWQVRYQGYR